MVFSSAEFLWFFLPITIALYGIAGLVERRRNTIKNLILLCMSLAFYAWGEPKYVLLMMLSIACNYLMGILIGNVGERADAYRKLWLIVAVLGNLGCLVLFKYTNFLLANIRTLTGTTIGATRSIALPIGISFYTFQAMSYVIDVYRGNNAPQKNPFKLALYISFFPQLIAGPIVKYRDIERELSDRRFSIDDFAFGVRRFGYGLGKKVIIANACAQVADQVFALNLDTMHFTAAWLGIICYTLQIYYDFSGYSDMAIGLGRMFGFHFNENFNFPYVADSIQEFWRRWHISLSSWFKEYLYIPLGGNRKGMAKTYRNLILVFLCTGIWHGANWTFVVWGLFHGLFQLLERGAFGRILRDKVPAALRHLYAMLVVMIGWVFFRADDVGMAIRYIGRMFAGSGNTASATLYLLNPYLVTILVVAVLLCGPFQSLCKGVYGKVFVNDERIGVWDLAMIVGIFALCMILVICDTYNPFIYFQF